MKTYYRMTLTLDTPNRAYAERVFEAAATAAFDEAYRDPTSDLATLGTQYDLEPDPEEES